MKFTYSAKLVSFRLIIKLVYDVNIKSYKIIWDASMDDKNYIDVDSIAPSSSNVDINIRQNCVKMSIVLSSILVSQFDFRQIKKKENNGTLI